VKNLLKSLIISIIDEENHSLLHYLVVWGYDAGIQLLETESTLETTLKNKRNFTPVHFAFRDFLRFHSPLYSTILCEKNSQSHVLNRHIVTLFRILMKKLDAH
jgi:hypothetical protein